MKFYVIAASLLLLLAGCGGGSGGSSDPLDLLEDIVDTTELPNDVNNDDVITPPPTGPDAEEVVAGDGAITGRVFSAIDNLQLPNALVTLSQSNGDVVATTMTDDLGTYSFSNLPREGAYLLTFELDTYLTEVFNAFSLSNEEGSAALEIPPVGLLSNDNAGVGSLSGIINSAVDGTPLEGITLEFVRGINNPNGELVATTMTDENGAYSVQGLPFGNYTCIIFGDGLQTSVVTVFVVGNADVSNQNATISPVVVAGQTRIVLTWGESPSDLDSHFTGPTLDGTQAFRVFFGNTFEDDVQLDTDDVSSFGPETITIENSSRPGVFRYSVFNFSNGNDPDSLSSSQARVQVIREEGVIADFFVPQGQGNLWSVFDMVNGEIIPIGTITIRATTDDHFAPATLLLNASASTFEAARNRSFK